MNIPDTVRWHIKEKEKEKTSKAEALYISQVIKLFQRKLKEKYSSILDVACGNGRLHPFLRKLGFEVFGIDNSKELIQEAQRKYIKFQEYYKVADMRKFNFKRKFDVALSWFTSFGYFKDKDNLTVLKNVSKLLRKNGLFLLEIPNAPTIISQIRSFHSSVLKQDNFIEIVYYKLVKIKNQIFLIFDQNFYLLRGKDLKFLKREVRKVRLYSLKEIAKLLSKAKFKMIKVLESMSLKQANEKTTRILIIAQKI
jgi:SAM-dependent methyltransferase